MPLDVALVVLLSALLHAGWNALVRSSTDKLHSTLWVVGGAGALSLVLLPGLPLPERASWPHVAASGLIHVVYFTLVALAYRSADLALAYPLMRGTAPVLAALGALLWLQESPSPVGWLGIALICAGVLTLTREAWRQGGVHLRALALALANAGVIALYTLVDGQGARLSGHALAYTAWVFLLTAGLMLAVTTAWRGGALLRPAPGSWRAALLGGAGTLAAYSMVLWAMTRAPIASVAALRETSIVFAALIGTLLLREHLSRQRLLSVLLVCAGAVAIKLA